MNLTDAAAVIWDVAIIGAGPAGSVAASIFAQYGRRVLLIEKSNWPREKVCGGCLNAAAVQTLHNLDLGAALRDASPITRAIWRVGHRAAEIPAGGVAIERSDLDTALVSLAIRRGVTFLPHTTARLISAQQRDANRLLQLQSAGLTQTIHAQIVLACDGIAGTSLEAEPWANWHIARSAWLGVAMTCPTTSPDVAPDAIHMHIAHGGYVGLVRMPNQSAHLAAALDPAECRRCGGPVNLIEKILLSSAFPISRHYLSMQKNNLHGIGPLTRVRPRLGGHRVLAVGDACGYVEPFTGEGIAWAIQSATAAADLLLTTNHWADDTPLRWERIYRAAIGKNQRWCAALRPLVHHPTLAGLAIGLAKTVPALPSFLSRKICRPPFNLPAVMEGAIA